MKKIYLVKVRDGDATTLPGYRGGGEYLVECFALVPWNGEHQFLQGFRTIKVKSSRVESCREVSHKEAP